MIEIDMVVERDDVEMDVIVRLECSPASRGSRDKYGQQLEPDEEADITFLDATLKNGGVEIELTDREQQQAIELGFESMANAYENSLPDEDYFEDR